MRADDTIGVFDSGVGGISVLHELRALLPYEDFCYVADSGHCPYGSQTDDYIRDRSLRITEWLIARGAKCVVVACNTATAAAAGLLRAIFTVPIIAMEPAIKPAVAATHSGVVGVLATVGTSHSERLTSLIERFGRGVQVLTQPCPGLVEHIEAGDLSGGQVRALLQEYVAPLIERGADTLVLGCTHYPFLRPLLAEIVGPEVALIDTGAAVARRTQELLATHGLVRMAGAGREQFWSSGELLTAERVISHLWGQPVAVRSLPV